MPAGQAPNIRNEIKSQIVKSGWTLTDIVKEMNKLHPDVPTTTQNISNKMARGTLKYAEAKVELNGLHCSQKQVNTIHHFLGILLQIIQFICPHQVNGQLIPAVKNCPERLIASKSVMVHLITAEFNKNILIFPFTIIGMQVISS